MKPQLDWASLTKLFNWMTNQPDPQPDITVATVFGQRYAVRLMQLCCGKLSANLQHSFARLLIWIKGYLVQ